MSNVSSGQVSFHFDVEEWVLAGTCFMALGNQEASQKSMCLSVENNM